MVNLLQCCLGALSTHIWLGFGSKDLFHELNVAVVVGFLSQCAVAKQRSEVKKLYCKAEEDIIAINPLYGLRLSILL